MTRPTRAVLAAAAIVSLLAGCREGSPRSIEKTPAASVAGTFTELAPDVFEPCGMTGTPGVVWVLACSGTVLRVPVDRDARSAQMVEGDIVSLSAIAGNGRDAVWVLLARGSERNRTGTVVRLDAASGKPDATIELGRSLPMSATVAGGKLWVAAIDGRLYTLDGTTARAVDSGVPLVWIAAGSDRTWTVAENGDVTERDAMRGRATRTIRTAAQDPIAAAAGLGSVWVSSAERGIVRLDLASGVASRARVTGTTNALEPCGERIWISQPDFGVRALDASGALRKSVKLRVASRYLMCSERRLWVLAEDGRLGWIDATT